MLKCIADEFSEVVNSLLWTPAFNPKNAGGDKIKNKITQDHGFTPFYLR
jgi:hypothetical protein